MFKYIKIEKSKKYINKDLIEKKIDLKKIIDYNLDVSILNTTYSLFIISNFTKKIPDDFYYYKRFIEELKYLQSDTLIELLITQKKIIDFIKDKIYIFNSVFDSLLIGYLMDIINYDPINNICNYNNFNKKIFFFELDLIQNDSYIYENIKKYLVNTDNIVINYNLEKSNINLYVQKNYELENPNSFFRLISNQYIDYTYKKINKTKKNLEKKTIINFTIRNNAILSFFNYIHLKEKDNNNFFYKNRNFIGIPLLEDVKYSIRYKDILINNQNDIFKILSNSTVNDILSLYNKNFNLDYFFNLKEKIEYIQKLTFCNNSEALKYYDAFQNKKIYMIDLFREKVKEKNNFKKKFINEICQRFQNNNIIDNNYLYNLSKYILNLIHFEKNNPLDYHLSIINNYENLSLYYRKWVYYRNLINYDIILNVGSKPWKVIDKKLISYFDFIDYNNSIINFKKYGFWNSLKFLDNMYFKHNEQKIYFRGLIASSRKYKINNDYYNLLTIGYDNNSFINLIIKGSHSFDKIDCLEGYGLKYSFNMFDYIIPNKFKNSFLN